MGSARRQPHYRQEARGSAERKRGQRSATAARGDAGRNRHARRRALRAAARHGGRHAAGRDLHDRACGRPLPVLRALRVPEVTRTTSQATGIIPSPFAMPRFNKLSYI
ncbi:hypothetical protein F01_490129 [Burkholderia cenocepacia]|nr:hypothetical protein F01_490129 [Burkholderia cenocepacia]